MGNYIFEKDGSYLGDLNPDTLYIDSSADEPEHLQPTIDAWLKENPKPPKK